MFRSFPAFYGFSALLAVISMGPSVNCDPKGGELATIYAGKNFQGDEREIYIENIKCFTLFGDWPNTVESIQFDENSCIQMYEGSKCDGRSKILRGQYKVDRDQGRNLALVNFDKRVRSLRLCA